MNTSSQVVKLLSTTVSSSTVSERSPCMPLLVLLLPDAIVYIYGADAIDMEYLSEKASLPDRISWTCRVRVYRICAQAFQEYCF